MTIKDLADELGVPKHKIEYQVRKIPQSNRIIIDGILHLNEAQTAIIKGKLSQNLPQNYTADIPQFLQSLEKLTQAINDNTAAVTKLIELQHALPKPRKPDSIITRIFAKFGFYKKESE